MVSSASQNGTLSSFRFLRVGSSSGGGTSSKPVWSWIILKALERTISSALTVTRRGSRSLASLASILASAAPRSAEAVNEAATKQTRKSSTGKRESMTGPPGCGAAAHFDGTRGACGWQDERCGRSPPEGGKTNYFFFSRNLFSSSAPLISL